MDRSTMISSRCRSLQARNGCGWMMTSTPPSTSPSRNLQTVRARVSSALVLILVFCFCLSLSSLSVFYPLYPGLSFLLLKSKFVDDHEQDDHRQPGAPAYPVTHQHHRH